MLALKKLAGVAPEMNLRITQVTKYARKASTIFKPGADVQKGGTIFTKMT